ncbi:tetratricopeptide repeat protein [Aeoliella sp. ICT_H6.2]|uniref:Tetratricopeptide repeat protein n=1 Tax=Aeoliella straminimaris TaxID=2954799 RepID=A0A9X2JJ12_9BACT|nr:tetratricopeptide repeat protein [Aeoliella straminimaris]
MADDNTNKPSNEPAPTGRPSLADRLHAVRDWASANRLRTACVSAGLLTLVVATVATWLYLAALTVSSSIPTLEQALEAYDSGEYEEARLNVVQLTESGTLGADELGGPLFVMGAVKAAEAEQQWSPVLRQSQFMIAAKYLQEAKSAGFPLGREQQGSALLGRALIESGDNPAGLEVLEESLKIEGADHSSLHLTLASAYMLADPPEYIKALEHLDTALEDVELTGEARVEALLDRVNALAKLARFNEARATLQAIPDDEITDSQVAIATGRIDIDELRRQLGKQMGDDSGPTHLIDAVRASIQKLKAISPADPSAEEAMYLAGVAHGLVGDTNHAIRQFERVRKLFNATSAGIAASVVEGDLYREQKRDNVQALTAYRRSLSVLDTPSAYRNQYLPLPELRQRMLAAHSDFLAQDDFPAAMTLVEQLEALLGKPRQTELMAETNSDWGRYLLQQAQDAASNAASLRRDGRLRLRKAGVEYEELSKRYFATPEYTRAIWSSADCYLEGQSYASVIRMLNEYLRYEPVQRNALALLRLGQAHLARGDSTEGVFALEECIELHPQDAAVFSARLDCAKAYRDEGRTRDAEQLLLANLHSSGLTPQSAEWRNSLFELGRLLHDEGEFDEAIDRLAEAIERDIDPDKARLANYLIAESFRRAAQQPLTELEQAKTANERESSTRDVQGYLNQALHHYEQVRTSIANSNSVTPLDRAMLRNCYMFKGSALFDLGRVERSPERFKAAIDEYSNVSTLYQNEPFVLETFVQIANCQRRLQEPVKAKLNIDQALQLLAQLPPDADFLATTNFTRSQWELMLTEMRKW